ncbi:uncharacterized protein BDFB_009997 [Asbolus verrucosus]|uniref:Uncharacterized protein n=1 Tax=Asbolus verrucosus TaxID=1661398 RepID=A0A482VYR0_ASBVE|nr:uncharacterized protein BDFB_009997 [Asbolus verrucosus]
MEVTIPQLALALRCYKCDSSESALCNYGIGSFTYDTVDCDEEAKGGIFTNWVPKQCVKLVAIDHDDKEYVARGCMPGIGGACKAVAKTLSFFSNIEGGIKDIDCFPCDGDKCNSASRYKGYTMVGVLLAALAFMF